ncbi:MAG TPA: c-type cytochrome [Kofleriaceae bacterium]|nr:c-type cytochrome [Kofleriaceae bacterium]
MRNRTIGIGLGLGLLAASVVLPATIVFARSVVRELVVEPAFQLSGRPVGDRKAAAPTAAYLTSTRITALGQEAALVIDADSGALVKTDSAGKNVAQVAIGTDAGLLTFDPVANVAFVARRMADTISVVNVGDTLDVLRTIKTPAEPYGVALSPDRSTLYVTTIADRTFVAYDVKSGLEKWRTPLGREPRGLAISPDGSRALVSYLTTGTVDQIDLVTRRAEHVALSTARAPNRRHQRSGNDSEAFARASFAVTFLGDRQAVVPFQRETPVQQRGGNENAGGYGGGFDPPITHQLAFIGFAREIPTQVTATISQRLPRAIAWDGARDALYVAGMGSDTLLQIKNASQVSITAGVSAFLTVGGERCGPDGLAITERGDVLVWCAFSRTVQRVVVDDDHSKLAASTKVTAGSVLVPSRMTAKQHTGMVLFHSANHTMARRGAMACASCHPDNRADGLSWRIEKKELQTPILAGRVTGTHPYKWDGGDKDLTTSLTMTMKRLGGSGLDSSYTAALAAYVEGLPAPRTPTRDTQAVARGKQVFDSAEAGCRSCHDGPAYTDQAQHRFSGTLAESDTPSLVGLAASAPYFHDGSATTLEAVLRDRGAVHGMGDASKLGDKQVADLIAFLETL